MRCLIDTWYEMLYKDLALPTRVIRYCCWALLLYKLPCDSCIRLRLQDVIHERCKLDVHLKSIMYSSVHMFAKARQVTSCRVVSCRRQSHRTTSSTDRYSSPSRVCVAVTRYPVVFPALNHDILSCISLNDSNYSFRALTAQIMWKCCRAVSYSATAHVGPHTCHSSRTKHAITWTEAHVPISLLLARPGRCLPQPCFWHSLVDLLSHGGDIPRSRGQQTTHRKTRASSSQVV